MADNKTSWPPKAKPAGADADANLFPRISVEAEVSGEVEPHTGVQTARITITVATKFISGFAFVPDGTCSVGCTDRTPIPTTVSTIENGYIAHSRLVGEMTNHFFTNQDAWRTGIEGMGRGVKMMELRWRGESQPDSLDGIMSTDIEFDCVAYWDGTNAVSSDVPEGDATSLTMAVTVGES